MSELSKTYSWKYIIDTLVIPGRQFNSLYYNCAIDCMCEFYDGSDPTILFSEKEVAFIQGEIKDEAEHKIRLAFNSGGGRSGLDIYIEKIIKKIKNLYYKLKS